MPLLEGTEQFDLGGYVYEPRGKVLVWYHWLQLATASYCQLPHGNWAEAALHHQSAWMRVAQSSERSTFEPPLMEMSRLLPFMIIASIMITLFSMNLATSQVQLLALLSEQQKQMQLEAEPRMTQLAEEAVVGPLSTFKQTFPKVRGSSSWRGGAGVPWGNSPGWGGSAQSGEAQR